MRTLLNLFRGARARLESDLERELRYHIERCVRDLAREGVSEGEARRRRRLVDSCLFTRPS